jgi:hypothetical protein
MAKLSEVSGELNSLKKKFQATLQGMVKEAFTDFFNSNPEVHCIIWAQYSPYFNDGDECTFSVHEFEAYLKNEDGDYEYEHGDGGIPSAWMVKNYPDDDSVTVYTNHPRFNEIRHSWEAFKSELSSVDEDVFQAIFGNHVQIVATAEGFDIEEYDHD